MTSTISQPFARHGAEKMIYDVRMGPQAVLHDGTLYGVYAANPNGAANHPHIIAYDTVGRTWSQPTSIARVPHYDHHFSPVLWFDGDERLHVLYGCHGGPGSHMVSSAPRSVEAWEAGPEIAPSISYPHVMPMADGVLVLYYRVFGHLGYWTYATSTDGGWTWERRGPLVDMDQRPEIATDTWTGSYHAVAPSADRRAIHIGFVYLDEQRRRNPLYNRRFKSKRTINRYHLYAARLDIATGEITTLDGELLSQPVGRPQAEPCMIWHTGHRLTNAPAILVDEEDMPSFMLPVSGKGPWDCTFYYVRREGGGWRRTPVAPTSMTWSGCLLGHGREGEIVAYVVSGDAYGETLPYGGGDVQEWVSRDGGATWVQGRSLVPEPGLLCNNPRWVERSNGETVPDMVTFFGWPGPGGIYGPLHLPGERAPMPHRGQAYLWQDGRWL